MQKGRIVVFCVVAELCIIIAIAIATQFSGWLFGVFYNGLYGLVLSAGIPIYLLRKAGEDFSAVGVKKPGPRQYVVLAVFVVLSIGGQLLPKIIAGERIPWDVLPMAIVPLIMTTFFEEFFSRLCADEVGAGFWMRRCDPGICAAVCALSSGISGLPDSG